MYLYIYKIQLYIKKHKIQKISVQSNNFSLNGILENLFIQFCTVEKFLFENCQNVKWVFM